MYVIDPAYFSLFEATCKQGKCNFRTLGVDVESRSMQVIWRDEKGGAILGSRIYMCFLCAIVKNLSFAWHFNNKWKNCFLRHCRKNSIFHLFKTTPISLLILICEPVQRCKGINKNWCTVGAFNTSILSFLIFSLCMRWEL